MPGIQDKNSKPDIDFSKAKFERFLSKVEEPTIIVFLSNREICEKDFSNFITIPLKPPSLIKVLDPAPKIKILLLIC